MLVRRGLQLPPPAEIDRLERLTENVGGWLQRDEGALLYALARSCRAGAIVEVGSWKGRSAIWIAEGTRAGHGRPVYAVDPHENTEEMRLHNRGESTFDEWRRNIEGARVDVTPILSRSVEAAQTFAEEVGMVFIDAAHDYSSVLADFQAWQTKLLKGGIVAFHDTWHGNGPWRVVVEEVLGSGHYGGLGWAHSVVFATRGDPPPVQRVLDRAALAAKGAVERAGRLRESRKARARAS